MQITANQDFRHGYDLYAKGKTYDVDPTLAHYFVFNGWADSDEIDITPAAAATETTLDIHDMDVAQGVDDA